jgi:HlyD family secretion protein
VTFDALPETTLSGTVELVAPAATSGQDVVSYLVRVAVAGAQQARPGMSATAQIEVERRPQVLQVPNRALSGRGPQRTLKVQTSGGIAEIEVEVGATNGMLTEVVSCPQIGRQCLREGDQVLINVPTSSAATDQQGGDVKTFSVSPAGGSSGGPARRVIIEGP